MATVRPYGKKATPKRAPSQGQEGTERDENGLTPWHYRRGEQVICGTCDCRPCTDHCTEQFLPDTLQRKASRANLTVEQWAAAHPDWIGWELHRARQDVAAFLAAAARATGDGGAPAAQERRIPLGAAMEQALAVMAGRVPVDEVAPVYERAPSP